MAFSIKYNFGDRKGTVYISIYVNDAISVKKLLAIVKCLLDVDGKIALFYNGGRRVGSELRLTQIHLCNTYLSDYEGSEEDEDDTDEDPLTHGDRSIYYCREHFTDYHIFSGIEQRNCCRRLML